MPSKPDEAVCSLFVHVITSLLMHPFELSTLSNILQMLAVHPQSTHPLISTFNITQPPIAQSLNLLFKGLQTLVTTSRSEASPRTEPLMVLSSQDVR